MGSTKVMVASLTAIGYRCRTDLTANSLLTSKFCVSLVTNLRRTEGIGLDENRKDST